MFSLVFGTRVLLLLLQPYPAFQPPWAYLAKVGAVTLYMPEQFSNHIFERLISGSIHTGSTSSTAPGPKS